MTLSKLRGLSWANYGPTFSLMSLLIAPELRDSAVQVTSCPDANLSTILPPQSDHFPLLIEPIALKHMCRDHSRACHFFYADGHLSTRLPPRKKLG